MASPLPLPRLAAVLVAAASLLAYYSANVNVNAKVDAKVDAFQGVRVSWSSSCQRQRQRQFASQQPLWAASQTDKMGASIEDSVDKTVRDFQQLLKANHTGTNTGCTGTGTGTDTDTLVLVEGYVIVKRGFGDSFCFLDVTEEQNGSGSDCDATVQVMLKRQEYGTLMIQQQQQQQNYFDGYMQSMLPGILVAITGVVVPSRNSGETLLLAKQIEIRGLPRNPQHVRIVLQAVYNGLLPVKEIAQAASMSMSDLEAALAAAANTTATTSSESSTIRLYGLAKQILKSLPPPEVNYPIQIIAMKNKRCFDSLPAPDSRLKQPPPELSGVQQKALQRLSQSGAFADDKDRIQLIDDEPVLTLAALLASKSSSDADDPDSAETTIMTAIQFDYVVGWVQNRRRFLDNVTVLEVVDQMERSAASEDYENRAQLAQLWNLRLKCVLHPDVVACGSVEPTTDYCGAAVVGPLLAPGSQVQLEGYYDVSGIDDREESDDNASPLFWVTRVRLLRASWRPSIVQYLIELLVKGTFDRHEAARALRQSDADIDRVLELKDLTARQWKAAEISAELQDAESRVASIAPESMRVLNSFADLRTRYPLESVVAPGVSSQEESSRKGSRWSRKKEPQLDWMAQQVKEVIESHPSYGQRPLKILDVGGGKGHLANHLAGLLGESVQIRVIDVAQRAVKNGAMRSKRLQLPVTYTVGDASKVDFSGEVDLVVALHACGALTDVALGHAIVNSACFVICPCCFRSNPQLQVNLQSTEGTGIDCVRVDDWLGVDPIDYDALKLLAEVQGDMALANQAIHSICALRASALKRSSNNLVNVSIRTFPVAFSSRNFCLVGSYDS